MCCLVSDSPECRSIATKINRPSTLYNGTACVMEIPDAIEQYFKETLADESLQKLWATDKSGKLDAHLENLPTKDLIILFCSLCLKIQSAIAEADIGLPASNPDSVGS